MILLLRQPDAITIAIRRVDETASYWAEETATADYWLDGTEEAEAAEPEPEQSMTQGGTMTQGAAAAEEPEEESEEESPLPIFQPARPTMLSSSVASAASSLALFSDPSRFDPDSARGGTHYLTDALGGTIALPFSSGLTLSGARGEGGRFGDRRQGRPGRPGRLLDRRARGADEDRPGRDL